MTFDSIYTSELPYVLNTLRRLGVRLRDLEDLAHDVFVIVHRQFDKFDQGRPLRPWLFGISFRVASTYRRKHSHAREELDERRAELAGADPWPVHRTRQQVVKALQQLEWECRAVMIMHDIDGATAAEIGETLQMPVNRVYSRLRIARRDFRTAMGALQKEAG
ncbi:MAG: sigma-70 family RNA polymerase sigma factor [Myxococcota bacterium]